MQDYWRKQTTEALFPNLAWARPETVHGAGKLLIVGGHAQSFAEPATVYGAADKAGIGVARVLLPDSLHKTVGKLFPAAEFTPSNPSGGMSKAALGELVAAATWADGVLLAGDLGRNSETTAMLENFVGKYHGQLTISRDAADFFCTQPDAIAERSDTLLVLALGQLRQLGTALRLSYAFTSDQGMVELVENLHTLTQTHPKLFIITKHHDQLIVAVQGSVSTTAHPGQKLWRSKTAAAAATWWLQNPTKPFEALTTSVL